MNRKRAPELNQAQLKFIFGGLESLRRQMRPGESVKLVELQKTVLNAAMSGGLARLNELDRVELRLMSEGLDALREEMRSLGHEIDIQKYNQVCMVQDKIDNAMDSTFY